MPLSHQRDAAALAREEARAIELLQLGRRQRRQASRVEIPDPYSPTSRPLPEPTPVDWAAVARAQLSKDSEDGDEP
jgi:hypothetical protein